MTVPAAVLAVTRGKRALVIGGQGAREDHRLALIEALELEALDWTPGERAKAASYSRLVPGIRAGRYGLVLFLVSFAGHKAAAAVAAVKDTGATLIYLNGGYSVAKVSHEIEKQYINRRIPE